MGLDPGLRAMVGRVSRHNNVKVQRDEKKQNMTNTQDTRIYAKAKSFRFRSGEFRHREKNEKYRQDVDTKYKNLLKIINFIKM